VTRESDSARLEHTIGLALRFGVTTSSICLAAGLVATFAGRSGAADLMLHAGVILLLTTPVVRVFISIVEYVRERDWTFVALTTIVLMELMASAVAALVFNRRV
jgi:uncharacterized membrane protein